MEPYEYCWSSFILHDCIPKSIKGAVAYGGAVPYPNVVRFTSYTYFLTVLSYLLTYLLIYLLTPRSSVHLEKLNGF